MYSPLIKVWNYFLPEIHLENIASLSLAFFLIAETKYVEERYLTRKYLSDVNGLDKRLELENKIILIGILVTTILWGFAGVFK